MERTPVPGLAVFAHKHPALGIAGRARLPNPHSRRPADFLQFGQCWVERAVPLADFVFKRLAALVNLGLAESTQGTRIVAEGLGVRLGLARNA